MISDPRELLRTLYFDDSKHSCYQSVPEFAQQLLGFSGPPNQLRRDDSSRYNYLARNLDFRGKRVIDIGANTGYFSLNLAHTFKAHVYAYEANENHAKFIRMLADYCAIDNIDVCTQGVSSHTINRLPEVDVILLLNVLHHIGVDFDTDLVRDRAELELGMVDYLRKVRTKSTTLVFQIGYNWGGNNAIPIVADGDEASKITFTLRIINQAGWQVDKISLPVFTDTIEFVTLNAASVTNSRSIVSPLLDFFAKWSVYLQRYAVINVGQTRSGSSEFFRRPLFICRR